MIIFGVSSAQEKDYQIAAIKVSGTRTLDNALIISLSGLRVGQSIRIPGQDAANAIRLLWKQGLFSHIDVQAERYQGDNVFLKIVVEEKPRLSRYKISGIKKGEIDDLRPKMELRSGVIFNDNLETNIYNIVNAYYKEKGFVRPVINIKKSNDTILPNSVALDINIDRGYRYKVRDIHFVDNKNVAAQTLRKAMKENKAEAKFDLKEMFRFKRHLANPGYNWYDYLGYIRPTNILGYASEFIRPNIFNAAKYKPEELKQADFAAIKDAYAAEGYRDAKIEWDTAVERRDHKMDLYVRVHEGKKYFIRDIKWVGNTKYSDTLLTSILDIRRGDVYNQTKIEERLQQNPNGGDVAGLYMDDGHLFFNIIPQETSVTEDSVDLTMRIYEGPQTTINNVTISGNEKTNEHVIRRELKLKPGDKFNRSQLIRTQRELMAMGYFDPQGIQLIPKPKEDGTVDIDVVVAEKPNDQLSLSLGYANMFYGQVGLNFTNFSMRNLTKFKYWKPLPAGDGQNFMINIQSSGRQSQVFNASFTEPWLGGKRPTSLTLSGTHSRFVNNFATGEGSYIRNLVSAELGTRLKWPDDYFVAFFGLTMENNVLDNYAAFNEFNTGSVNNLFGRFTLRRNSLNGPIGPQIYPTTGSDINFVAQATLPYSLMFNSRKINTGEAIDYAKRYNWIEYHKWKFSSDHYMPIVGNLVARMALRFGTLGSYNGDYGISPFERFRIGGDGLVAWNQYGQEVYALRGYNDNEVTIDENGRYFQGATVFNKYIFELRYPLMLNQQSSIYAMLFGEAGNGWERFSQFDPFKVKKAYGMGVRFFLPMFGLLGFDYGLGVDKAVPNELQNGSIFDKYGKFRFILSFEPQ